MKNVPSKLLKHARSLRQTESEAEIRLWGYLRNRRLQGHKFTRQTPVGPYIADFLCFERKLIIEVEGVTHSDAHEIGYDKKRTEHLEKMGYRVFRCFNMDVYENLNGVLDGILPQLQSPDNQR